MLKNILHCCILVSLFACNNSTHQPQYQNKINVKSIMIPNQFTVASWINTTNVYEVNLRQYKTAGTINAFYEELPRLKDMGVETLWFMPITPIAQKGKKGSLGSYYACSNYTDVDKEFGTVEDFKKLVAHAHEMGFKVIIDWVANHTGWDHVWTKTHPDYYLKDSTTKDFKIASGMDDIIELDYANPDLRNAMIDAMKFWVDECDVDGFRCDLAFWVELDFWLQARAELEKTKTLFWLAESDPLEKPEYYKAFDASYTWTWMHKSKEFYEGKKNLSYLVDSVLKKYDAVCKNDKIPLWFTTNHDENSWNGTEYEKYGDMAKALAVFSFTWNGMPMIYSGQELPNLKGLKFFDKDVIAWDGKYALQDFYKTLLTLKKTNPALRTADANVSTFLLTTDNPNILAFLRKNGNNEVLVLLNMSKQTIRFEVTDQHVTGKYKNIFGKVESDFTIEKFFEMQPWEYLVYEK
jgi:alpha-amylase